MSNKDREEKVKERAYEIYEWRCENGIEGDALGDYYEALAEIREEDTWDDRYKMV